MRRALIGFSSPVGYSYNWPAHPSANDQSSSPNPILMGSMGLFALYDELWFACESLCPQSMRKLNYVRFVDRDMPGLHPQAQGVEQFVEAVQFRSKASLNDLFEGGYEDMRSFAGADGAIDNHTHELRFLDARLNGNPGANELAIDIWLLEHLRHLELELVFNPITAKLAFDNAAGPGWPLRKEAYEDLRLADGLISLRNLYDITGPSGPYHPCIEEIRHDELLIAFRRWLKGERGRLGNQELRDIQRDVDERIRQLEKRAISKYLEQYSLKSVAIDLIKAKLGEAIGIPYSLIEYLGRTADADAQRSYAFIGRARSTQERAG